MNQISIGESRRNSRELLLQALFQLEFSNTNNVVEALVKLKKIFSIEEKTWDYALHIANGIQNNFDEIDTKISALCKNWSINRLAFVDKNILRISLFELLYTSDIPEKVAINEAIEIAKKYGSSESSQFINGVLDQALKEKS